MSSRTIHQFTVEFPRRARFYSRPVDLIDWFIKTKGYSLGCTWAYLATTGIVTVRVKIDRKRLFGWHIGSFSADIDV